MPPPPQTPGPTDVVSQIVNAGKGSVLVAEPAFVISYNPQTQRAICQPILSSYYTATNDDGHEKEFQRPVPDVPVMWPVWSTGALVGTLSPGDRVILLVNGRSLDEFKATNADNIQQQDKRRHSYADAVAFPLTITALQDGQYAEDAVVLSGDDVRLGSSTATSPVALATPTDTNFTALQTLLDAIAAIPTNPAEPTASLILAAVVTFLNLSGYPVATAATRVKAL